MDTDSNEHLARGHIETLEKQLKTLQQIQERQFWDFLQQADMGYGRAMQLAQKLWRETLVRKGMPPGGEFQYGPCVAMTVPCGCDNASQCEWCCGSGWLTKKVKAVKDQTEISQS